MFSRPKRAVKRPNYRELADVKVPRIACSGSRNRMTTSSTSSELYRLRILERDEENGSVKVRYIGYGEDFDEWRKEEDIVNLEEDDSSADGTPPFSCQPELPTFTKFCLYKEMAFRIKSMLYSNRKADPLCSIVMSFDTVHFEGLIRRGIRRNEVGGKKEMYGLASLTKLDDLLGEMWYIRGLNDVGDFCYIEPSTVKYYLRSCKGKLDHRLKEDGTIVPTYFGARNQLVFQFVRNDGTSLQWHKVLQSCRQQN